MQPELKKISEQLIYNWIKQDSRVLDLGCGDGHLLAELAAQRSITGYGVELDPLMVIKCVDKGVSAIHADIENELSLFADNSFDVVVLLFTLEELANPTAMLEAMMRVASSAIVVFTNAGHWQRRLRYLLGKVSQEGAVATIVRRRLITINDFESLCRERKLNITKQAYISENGNEVKSYPAIAAELAVYQLERG